MYAREYDTSVVGNMAPKYMYRLRVLLIAQFDTLSGTCIRTKPEVISMHFDLHHPQSWEVKSI